MSSFPKYKRDEFVFVSNLQKVTADPNNPITGRRESYLLSEHYTNNSLLELADWARKSRNLMMSDNGNFTRMKVVAKVFETRAELLITQAKEEVKATGKISLATAESRRVLMDDIKIACWAAVKDSDYSNIIETQLKMRPHYMIGHEDLTIPVMMMSGLMLPMFSPTADEVTEFQDKTASLYHRQCEGDFGFKKEQEDILKFLVLHAYDYKSALAGSQKLNDIPPQGIAISYGGPMRSRRYISELDMGNEKVKLPEKLPEPYLISQAITLGAMNGLEKTIPIHILGVGSPILIVLIASLLRHSPAISIDSTSPFKDAYAGTLYGSKYAYMKMDMYKIAAYALINNKPYKSRTPFYRAFEEEFPSNWERLRSELAVTSSMSVKSLVKTLKSNPDLIEREIPFFAKMRSGNDRLINQLRMARSGHNYWILRNICINVRLRKSDPDALMKWVNYQIDRYSKIGSPKWVKAVQVSFDVMERFRKQNS